ncbi:protein MEI2-like 2 isoform X1 [Setaria viridis]|nr:protein MEI2-like 2 isoform X1 [Setaria viridis]
MYVLGSNFLALLIQARYLPRNAVMDPSPHPFNPPGLAVPPPSKPRQMAASNNPWRVAPPPLQNARAGFGDASLFSTSLPLLPHEKLNFPDSAHGTPSMDDTSVKMKTLDDDPEEKDYKFDFDLRQIDDLLPDEDEFFAGITDEIEPIGQTNNTEELEEFDVFGSGGGMELDLDPLESVTASFANSSIADGARGNGINPFGVPSTVGTVAGEHPYGEHPSRTLFVRNINSNVEDSELRSLFEQYGDIRTLYTATKHRGFVMISYFDIRSARNAMRALQNKPLRRRKLDIHFSIPKENPSDKDLNQGTLVIFNLDPSVSNEEVRQIFGAYGEVKEIRETPNKKHHKFIEFYDIRAAEAALRSLNKSEIAGKRIKLEPSRPGGTRRNLMQQLGHDLDQEEPRSYRHHHVGSPIANSPPGAWAHYSSPTDNNVLQALNRSPTGNGMSPIGMPSLISNAVKIAPIGKDSNRSKYDHVFSNGNQSVGGAFQHSHSYQDRSSEHMSSSPGTLSGPQFLWGSPKPYSETSQSPVWRPPAIGSALSSTSRSQGQGFLHGSRQASLFGSSDQHHHHHHVGSAPSGAPFESHFGFLPESPETSFMKQVRFGNMGNIGTGRNGAGLMLNMAGRSSLNPISSLSGSLTDNSSTNFRPMLSPRLGHAFYSNPTYQGPGSFGLDSSIDRGRNRRVDSSALQADSKRQYQLDLEKIRKGDDTRTTLMIKNIPNKYTSKMLLAAIDELHKGTYDFFYLPIDFKNKCNVGYAFINMISPTHIISFYQAFNGKKWEKFNSEKVASLAYARIQGRTALISHFQNSSLMNEDKRCRPILFHPNGLESGNQDAFPINGICIHMPVEDDLFDDEDDKSQDVKMGGESSMQMAGSL